MNQKLKIQLIAQYDGESEAKKDKTLTLISLQSHRRRKQVLL